MVSRVVRGFSHFGASLVGTSHNEVDREGRSLHKGESAGWKKGVDRSQKCEKDSVFTPYKYLGRGILNFTASLLCPPPRGTARPRSGPEGERRFLQIKII